MIPAIARAAFLVFALGAAAVPFDAAAQTRPVAAAAPKSYATAEAAVSDLIDALRANKPDVLQAVFGPDAGKLLNSGDKIADAGQRQKFLAAFDERHELTQAGPGRMVLQVGNDKWPLPIPLVQVDGSWRFDTAAGAQELIDRRIGRNEIAAIRTALAYVDAQKAYFALTGQHGEPQYAQRVVASPGKYDGLYWPSGEGVPDSPLEPLVAQAREEGYPIDHSAGGPRPYHGYYFRILTAQGLNSPEGRIDYISNGRMTKGFALVAWPASYGASGIMSFIVNQNGVIFQRDLGPNTAAVAAKIKSFDPDLNWDRVEIVD